MIITRTPFRMPLGGGGTDLPGFYKKHGGYIFSATIDKYMYVAVNRPFIDKLVRLKYSKSETVQHINDLEHELAREGLRFCGIEDSIEVTSFADISAGTGMGSSSSYLIGLLKALHTLNRTEVAMEQLAEEACHIEMNILKSPVGKQDQYLASIGGFVEMEIDTDGNVRVQRPVLARDTIEELEYNTCLFFTNKFHSTANILADQNKNAAVSESQVEKSLLAIKDIGKQIKSEFQKGNVQNFGKLLDEHWNVKKQMSSKISDPEIDRLYDLARAHGAEGGKIMGSGGGGLFLFYAPKNKKNLKEVMKDQGLSELSYKFDFEGSKTLLNIYQYSYSGQ